MGDGMCLKSLYDSWKQYSIGEPEQKLHALMNELTINVSAVMQVRESREKQRKQSHSGVILNE